MRGTTKEGGLTAAQKRVVAKLEGAFQACAAAGICFHGMDSSLLAFHEGKLAVRSRARGNDGILEALMDLDQGYSVDTYNAYKDSGGW